ncbi:hypothetical protein AX16_006776 [Volvariella volvacea WC 439]|nr:hypothetical protein AX16_006776 [Volvariella volvacea WC 439]
MASSFFLFKSQNRYSGPGDYYTPLPASTAPTPSTDKPGQYHKHSSSSSSTSSDTAAEPDTGYGHSYNTPEAGYDKSGHMSLPGSVQFVWYTVKSRWQEHISPLAGALMLVLMVVFGLTIAIVVFALKRPRYNPLDNYQDINHAPLVKPEYTSNATASDERAVVSTLYTDSYALSVAVLAYSIRKARVNSRLILGYLADRVSPEALCIAQAAGWDLLPIQFIAPPHNGSGISQRFTDQYTKLNIWGLDKIGIRRAVYLDADTLVRRNFDELFDAPWDFAAVQDVYDKLGFVVAFNAGVMAFTTSSDVLEDMKAKIEEVRFPKKEAEQAFLNVYYGPKAVRLPYAYNANLAIKQRCKEMWRGMEEDMRIVHYTVVKPFLINWKKENNFVFSVEEMRQVMQDAETREKGLFKEEVRWWAEAFEEMWGDIGHSIGLCSRRT